ncbi:hypothetical protein ACHAQH_007293 [Verticillium albo-atrum]
MSIHWLPTTITMGAVSRAATTNSPPTVERGLFHTPSRHPLPRAINSTNNPSDTTSEISLPDPNPTTYLTVRPRLPAFFTTPETTSQTTTSTSTPTPLDQNASDSDSDSDTSTTTAPPPYEQAVYPSGSQTYYIPNPPPGIPAGPYDLRNEEHRRTLSRLRLLPDDPSHSDPSQGVTPAPPPGSIFRRGALADFRPWWEAQRERIAPVFGQLRSLRAAEETTTTEDGAEERWETISVGEAEEAKEEHVRWLSLRERERGFIAWDRGRGNL